MASAEKATRPLTSPLVPDLVAVRTFITEMLAKGAIVALIEAILGLLTRMRDLNTDLVQQLAQSRRARPHSERTSALQAELPFAKILPANDDGGQATKPDDEKKKKTRKKRGPDKEKKHRHGRGTLPEWMERVVDRQLVPEGERTCPHCGVEGKTLCFKHCEKLSIRPVQYVVERVERETISCPKCHEWVRTAPRGDEVLDRGKLGNELLVQACVDHFDHAIPWDRMACVARQQGVPLSANTLARSVGRLIDLFDPIVAHITAKVLSSEYVSLDATSYRVLDDEHPRGIRTGSLWSLAGDHRYALFFVAPTGHADHLKERLKGYKLSLAMCDGSATNNVIEAEDGCGAIRGGCWAHYLDQRIIWSRATGARIDGSFYSVARDNSTTDRKVRSEECDGGKVRSVSTVALVPENAQRERRRRGRRPRDRVLRGHPWLARTTVCDRPTSPDRDRRVWLASSGGTWKRCGRPEGLRRVIWSGARHTFEGCRTYSVVLQITPCSG